MLEARDDDSPCSPHPRLLFRSPRFIIATKNLVARYCVRLICEQFSVASTCVPRYVAPLLQVDEELRVFKYSNTEWELEGELEEFSSFDDRR